MRMYEEKVKNMSKAIAWIKMNGRVIMRFRFRQTGIKRSV